MERYYIHTARVKEMIKVMSEEREEARKILQELYARIDETWQCIRAFTILDDMNMRGMQIVYAYEYSKNNMLEFMENIRKRSQNMVGYVNSKLPDYPKEYQAVREGASRTGELQLPPNPDKRVRIINIENEILYELTDGEAICVEAEDKVRISICRYLDDNYMLLDNYILHLQEFARIVEAHKYRIFPADAAPKSSDRILGRNEKAFRKEMMNKGK